jgi:hypothetical protein
MAREKGNNTTSKDIVYVERGGSDHTEKKGKSRNV